MFGDGVSTPSEPLYSVLSRILEACSTRDRTIRAFRDRGRGGGEGWPDGFTGRKNSAGVRRVDRLRSGTGRPMRFRAAQSRRGVSITLGRANPCGHSRSIQRILRHVPIYSSHSHGLTPATTIQPIFLPRLAMHQIAPEGKFLTRLPISYGLAKKNDFSVLPYRGLEFSTPLTPCRARGGRGDLTTAVIASHDLRQSRRLENL